MKKTIRIMILAALSTSALAHAGQSTSPFAYYPTIETEQESREISEQITRKLDEIVELTRQMPVEDRQIYAAQINYAGNLLINRGGDMILESSEDIRQEQEANAQRIYEEANTPYVAPPVPADVNMEEEINNCRKVYKRFRKAGEEFPKMERLGVCKYIGDKDFAQFDIEDGLKPRDIY